MIRLLLDQGLPRRASADLRARGCSVEHVGDLGLANASDGSILKYASAHGMVVVTLDSDFARLVAISRDSEPSLIHIRIARVTRNRLVDLLAELLPRLEGELAAGAIVSVDESGARVRRLPVVS